MTMFPQNSPFTPTLDHQLVIPGLEAQNPAPQDPAQEKMQSASLYQLELRIDDAVYARQDGDMTQLDYALSEAQRIIRDLQR
jgi:hypothetical protein